MHVRLLQFLAMIVVSSLPSVPVRASVIEAETLPVLERTGLLERQAWEGCSGGGQVWWCGDPRPGEQLVLGIKAPQAGRFRVFATLTHAPDYGVIRLSIDGGGTGRSFDLYADRVVPRAEEIEIGVFAFEDREHRLEVTMLGAETDGKPRAMAGIDALRFEPADEAPLSTPQPLPRPGRFESSDLVDARRFIRVYDGGGEAEPWYLNDHTFVRDDEGAWHLIGITHAEPAAPLDEKHFAHATAPSLHGPWTKQPFALSAETEKWNEAVLWAPHVIRHDGLYYLFYCAGDADHARYKLHVATSPDLKTWTRSDANPLVVDGFDARDPMVLRVGDKWVMYYTGNSAPDGGEHVVFAVTSDDLLHWGQKRIVFRSGRHGREGGPTESPFVVRRGEDYYLFCGAWEGYLGTYAFRSRDPFQFDLSQRVGSIHSHASEIIRDSDGSWYASHVGWGQGGVHLATLRWSDGLDEADTSLPPPKEGGAR